MLAPVSSAIRLDGWARWRHSSVSVAECHSLDEVLGGDVRPNLPPVLMVGVPYGSGRAANTFACFSLGYSAGTGVLQ